jgi:hypothetical protein
MSPQLGNIGVEADFGKQGGDFRTQSAGWDVFSVYSVTQNIPYLLFHAPAIPPGAALQLCLDLILDVADNKLGHDYLLSLIAIS